METFLVIAGIVGILFIGYVILSIETFKIITSKNKELLVKDHQILFDHFQLKYLELHKELTNVQTLLTSVNEKLTNNRPLTDTQSFIPRKSLFLSADGTIQARSIQEFLNKLIEKGILPPPNDGPNQQDMDAFGDELDGDTQ